jgi:hypothetical protein
MRLCDEYKRQLEIINEQLKIKNLKKKSSLKKDFKLIKEIASLNAGKRNLELSIYWMTHAHERGVYQGIDNIDNARKSYGL